MACKHRDPKQSVHVIDCYFLKSRTDCVGGHTHTELKNQKPKTKNKQNITKEKKRKEKEEKKAVTKNWPDRDSNPDPQN